MDEKAYQQLSQWEQASQDGSPLQPSVPSRFESVRRNLWKFLLGGALLCSVCLNASLLSKSDNVPWRQEPTLSKYVNLARNVPTWRNYSSIYSDPDRKVADKAWEKIHRDVEGGWVALEDTYSESVHLPHSVRWPWDNRKGIYILSGAHEVHCVIVLRTFVNNVNDGDDLQYSYQHAAHCIEVLRDTIMCAADDYPLYKGALNAAVGQEHPRAGFGTVKLCRDWDKMVAWANERSACWKEAKEEKLEDKFKHCPDGSRPWE